MSGCAQWQAAYGRSPDPVRAYSEAIKAVECAAHAVIQPNNAKATLGTMLGEIKNARHKFSAAIPSPAGDPIAPAEAMMLALWEGADLAAWRPDHNRARNPGGRPGRGPPRRRPVQWFISGAVVRTP
ncbi:hypothetical protein [Streptomyces paradoxus]|uniref:hypothetical protein n=1 Tax=Streptomyces paradoxus TaxID=66375 RepID=UPI00381119D2